MTEVGKQVVFVCCCLKNPAVPHYRKAPNTHWHGCTAFFFFPILSIIESPFFSRTSLGQSTAPSNPPFSYTTLNAAWFRSTLSCLQVRLHSSYKGLPPPLPWPIHDTAGPDTEHSEKKFRKKGKGDRKQKWRAY